MWNLLIVNPMINGLMWLYALFGNNYFWAVVVATVLTRLLTFPLQQRQLETSKKMQEIQPKLKKIQDKYQDNPQELQRRMGELYREAGVNPAMGCLPMLIQFPILIGFYQAITRSLAASPLQLLSLSQNLYTNLPDWLPDAHNLIPLHSQFLWLNLAAPDPYYILPVLAVISTILYQRMVTPPTAAASSGNEQQAAMTRAMQWMSPLMIGFFAATYPSGLAVYWVTGNVIMFVQYLTTGHGDIKNLFGEDGKITWRGILGLPPAQPEPVTSGGRRRSSSGSRRNR